MGRGWSGSTSARRAAPAAALGSVLGSAFASGEFCTPWLTATLDSSLSFFATDAHALPSAARGVSSLAQLAIARTTKGQNEPFNDGLDAGITDVDPKLALLPRDGNVEAADAVLTDEKTARAEVLKFRSSLAL